MANILYLKFGAIKGGDFADSPEASKAFSELTNIDDRSAYKAKACEVITLFKGKIFSWWDNQYVSKKKAKEYINTYETNNSF